VKAKELRAGVYEHVLTKALARGLTEAQTHTDNIKVEQLASLVSRHVAGELRRLFALAPSSSHMDIALDLTDRLFGAVAEVATRHKVEGADFAQESFEPPARRLLAVGADAKQRPRPQSPLASSTLFTRSALEPRLSAELAHEIGCADRVDAIVAFITVGGVRSLGESLERLCLQGGAGRRLRVLTSAFTGTTEVEALDRLASLPNAEVKISLDVRRTRLHAKAWLFHRERQLSTAYVGSANFTSTALGAGHEWMMKSSAADLPHVLDHFAGTFETLWEAVEFETYDPGNNAQRARLREVLRAERSGDRSARLTLVTLTPYPFQQAILERLEAERAAGHRRNLVVAATGTGKTVIAAFDYARVAKAYGARPRLLMLAHRYELIEQACNTFRHVLGDASFGELLSGGSEIERGDYVFATVQSAGRLLERFAPDYWSHVIVDECHHLPAKSYQDIITSLQPTTLVGLTATPERMDGRSLLSDFDGRVAAELRLWHAMEQQLLVPFDYYGISDDVDLSRVRWSRNTYDAGALSDLYTGHHARADLVLRQLEARVANLRDVRGLGFCVSVEHAEFMAVHSTSRGVPAIAIHGGTSEDVREDAKRRLREREVNLVFTCDLYNEGVDLPFVDTLLLLRPTMSATLFLQQLGRGLRLYDGKEACLVLDFIGQHREEYKFDSVLSALTGLPRAKLRTSVENDFPLLPSGCAVTLDRVAREQIIASLKRAVGGGAALLAKEVAQLAKDRTEPLGLGTFLAETGRELSDVYRSDFGWRHLLARAGQVPANDDADELSRQLGRLIHVDDPEQLRRLASASRAADGDLGDDSEYGRRRTLMLSSQMTTSGAMRTAQTLRSDLRAHASIAAEAAELAALLETDATPRVPTYVEPDWPLALHRRYTRAEILVATGHLGEGDKPRGQMGGIRKDEQTKRELFFVTLDKSGGDFSPTTSYRDYVKSPDLFHWETQGSASRESSAGKRYLESPANGWRFFLFVQLNKDEPYTFVGEILFRDAEGDRPIGITWSLRQSLPADLYDRFAVLNQT
jgi:superfamily II DNA or RNA helicase/HKD family nuclease